MPLKAYGLLFVAGVLLALAMVSFYKTEPSTEGKFGGVSLTIEYAASVEAREKGLGGRASIPEGYGMLFVFPKEDYYGFWMKDMQVPIDIFWLDDKRQVVSSVLSVTPESYPNVFYPSAPARYVLETAAGFGKAHNITIGTPLLLKNLERVSK